ncbi:MAG: ShlB/FhaC/HecB family hemolysin secretion/activation protein [Chlamydiota bacterium]
MRLKNVFLTGGVASATLWAQVAHCDFVGPPSTSAGIVEREIEKEYELKKIEPQREIPLIEIDIPEEQLDMGDGETALITSISLQGNDVLSSKVIRSLVAKYENLELSMKDIKELCLKIQERYVKKGYFLARVYPPAQEVKEGKLTLEVIEGRLGEVTVQGQKHYKETFIRKYFAKFQGKAINYDDLLKVLFLVNENSDLQVGAIFKKGQESGTADLIIQVQDKRPCHLFIDENNYGAQNTTIWRTGAKFDYGNLFTGGDTFSLTEVVGNPVNNLNFTNASYQIPLNTIGTAIKFSYLYSYFHVSQAVELNLRGKTQIGSVEVSQACTRSRNLSTDMYASFDYKQMQNYQGGITTSNDKLRIFTLGFTFDGMDALRGRNIADVYYTCGIPHILGGLKTETSLSSRKGSGGSFSILNVDYTRIQTLSKKCFLMLHASGQATPYKLPLSEQMYIGGIGTVRGFPMAAALGDDGYYANLELRTPFPGLVETKVPFMHRKWKDFLQLIGFVDQGGVLLNGGGEDQKKHLSMTSAGVGVRIFAPFHINISFDIGFPLTEEKKQSSPVYYFRTSIQPF